MDTNDTFYKIASGEELTDSERIGISEQGVTGRENGMIFAQILSGEEVSIEQKLEIARSLVADNVAEILQREMVVSHVSGNSTSIILKAKECRDSDDNLRKFLTILGAKDIDVSSDFPGYCESYEGHTTIKFKY